MKKYKYFMITAVLLLIGQQVFAQPLGRGMGRGMGYWVNYNNAYAAAPQYNQYAGYQGFYNQPALNLTQEQSQKINDIRTQFSSQNVELYGKLLQKRIELQNLMSVENIDQNTVNLKIDEINKTQAEIQKKNVAFYEKMRNVLTDEQKAVADTDPYGYGAAGFVPYGRGLNCVGGFGMYGRGRVAAGAGMYPGMGRWNMRGFGRGPCGMGLGKMAVPYGW